MANLRVLVTLLLTSTALTAQAPAAVSFDGLGRSNPTAAFDHGYVAAWDLVATHSLTLFDRAGQRLFDVTEIPIPGKQPAKGLMSIAVDADGISAIAFWGDMSTSAGVALVDKTGSVLRVIETLPYHPAQVCFAPDHSIWVSGDERQEPSREQHDYMTVRHYSREGTLLGSYLPRTALPEWKGAGLDSMFAPAVGHWQMRASADHIGMTLRTGEPYVHLWVELNLHGQLTGQWTYRLSEENAISPAAFTSENVLYGQRYVAHRPVGLWVFDRATSGWKPVSGFARGTILGADGTDLIYQKGDELRWVGVNMAVQVAAMR